MNFDMIAFGEIAGKKQMWGGKKPKQNNSWKHEMTVKYISQKYISFTLTIFIHIGNLSDNNLQDGSENTL